MSARTPTKREIEKIAREIHRCPENYEGPCWGPTEKDMRRARLIAEAEAAETP